MILTKKIIINFVLHHLFRIYNKTSTSQELRAYNARLCEANARLHVFAAENEELKQLCLYLDEQRSPAKDRGFTPSFTKAPFSF